MKKPLFIFFSLFLIAFTFSQSVFALAPLTPSAVQTKITTINSSLTTVETNLNSAINTFKSAIPNSETTLWTPAVIANYTNPFLVGFQTVKAKITSYIPIFSGCTTRDCQELWFASMNGPLIEITQTVLDQVKELQGISQLILTKSNIQFTDTAVAQLSTDIGLYTTADKTAWTATDKTTFTTLQQKLTDLAPLKSAFLLLWEPQIDKATFIKTWLTGSVLQPTVVYHDFATFNTKFATASTAYSKWNTAVTALQTSLNAFKTKVPTPVQLTLNISSIDTKRESTPAPYPVGYWSFIFSWTTKTLSPYELYYYTKLPVEAERNDKWQLLKKDIVVSDVTSSGQGNPYFRYDTFPLPGTVSYTALQDPAETGKMICFKVKVQNATLESQPKCVTPNTTVNSGVFINKTVPNFVASNITPRQATFTWASVSGAVGYAIYRDDDLVKIVKANEALSYTELPILMPESEYVYSIVPLNSLENVPLRLSLAPTALAPVKGFFATIQGFLFGEEVNAEEGRAVMKVTTKALPNVPKSGELKILAIVMKFQDTKLEDVDTVESVRQKLFEEILDTPEIIKQKVFSDDMNLVTDSVKLLYERESFGKLKITGVVVPQVISVDELTPTGKYGPTSDVSSRIYIDANQKSAELGDKYKVGDYNVVIYVTPAIPTLNFAGRVDEIGQLDTEATFIKGIIWMNGRQKFTVYAHELGHILGLSHDESFICATREVASYVACKIESYSSADKLNVMGYASSLLGAAKLQFDVFQKVLLGWSSKVPVTKTQMNTVYPSSLQNRVAYVIDLKNSSIDDKNPLLYLDFSGRYLSVTGRLDDINRFHPKLSLDYSYVGEPPKSTTYLLFFQNRSALEITSDPQLGVYKTPTTIDGNFTVKKVSLILMPSSEANSYDPQQTDIFVRFEDKTRVIATPNVDPKKIDITWSLVPELDKYAGGYRLYRDYNLNAGPNMPIYTGRNRSFVDAGITDSNTHTYTVIPYDAFAELPGKEYPLTPSDPSNPIKLGVSPTPAPTPAPQTGLCTRTKNTYPDGSVNYTYTIKAGYNVGGTPTGSFRVLSLFSDGAYSSGTYGGAPNVYSAVGSTLPTDSILTTNNDAGKIRILNRKIFDPAAGGVPEDFVLSETRICQ